MTQPASHPKQHTPPRRRRPRPSRNDGLPRPLEAISDGDRVAVYLGVTDSYENRSMLGEADRADVRLFGDQQAWLRTSLPQHLSLKVSYLVR